MLEKIRKHSKSWWVKSLMGILLASFALSGVSAGFHANFNDDYVVKVGNYKIYQQTIDRKLNERVEELRSAGLNLSEEQLQAAGINKSLALRELVQQSLVEQEVASLGLSVGDAAVLAEIRKLPILQKNGQYDVEQLRVLLYQRGLREKQFTENVRQSLAQAMLMDSVTRHLPASDYIAAESMKHFFEKRDVEFVTVPKGYNKQEKEPTEDDLKNFYLENSVQFEVPETRKIEYIVLPKNADKEKEFNDIAKIEDELAAGSTMAEVAAKQGLKLGKVDKFTKDDEKFSEKFAEIALNASENDPTQVVEDEDGSHFVINVLSIADARIPDLAEVKARVVEAWKEDQQKTQDAIFANELFEKAKNEENLQQISTDNNLPIQTMASITRDSKDKDFQLVTEAFLASEGEVFGVYEDEAGGFKVARLSAVRQANPTPDNQKSYAQAMNKSVGEDVLDQYFAYLRTKYPVKENKKVVK